MNRSRIWHLLDTADRNVSRGRVMVASQRGRIDQMRLRGRAVPDISERLLELLEQSLALHVTDRDRLIRELQNAAGRGRQDLVGEGSPGRSRGWLSATTRGQGSWRSRRSK